MSIHYESSRILTNVKEKSALTALPRLQVSPNHRFIIAENGTPFFWMGDTAWELFHRLTREEAERYFANRQANRFTVIQAVALAEFDGLNTPNAYGERPLLDNDPTRPNEAYFVYVDEIIQMAARHGLYVGLLPTWGDKVNHQWGAGPVVFDPENAEIYGRFLGGATANRPTSSGFSAATAPRCTRTTTIARYGGRWRRASTRGWGARRSRRTTRRAGAPHRRGCTMNPGWICT